MQNDSMNEALKRRRQSALDITILLNGQPVSLGVGQDAGGETPMGDENEQAAGEDEAERKEMDLAPKGTAVGEETDEQDLALSHGDEEQDKALIEQELAKMGVGKNSMLSRNMKKTQPLSSTEV